MSKTNTATVVANFELLSGALQAGVKAHEVKGAELAKHHNCQGCGKHD